MCGVFAILNNDKTYARPAVEAASKAGAHRGPEESTFQRVGDIAFFGFERLAINGVGASGSQPIIIDGVTLVCNGEIYNSRELLTAIGVSPQTGSDCEVIIHLYRRYGIEDTLGMLDGVFAFALYDNSDYDKGAVVHVARDPLGVRPLYELSPSGPRYEDDQADDVLVCHERVHCFASELKQLSTLMDSRGPVYYDSFRPDSLTRAQGRPPPPSTRAKLAARQFPPGTYSSFALSKGVHAHWTPVRTDVPYARLPVPATGLSTEAESVGTSDYELRVWHRLNDAVRKRVVGSTERRIACCLSGGLDSSLIAALVSNYYDGVLETYAIGMPGSDDLRYARVVAAHIGSKHTEITPTADELWEAIPAVVRAIESYDTTTVRASVGNYLVGQHIARHSDAKVVFNGDGSDELAGGYLYLLEAPNSIEFDVECRRLLKDIHAFDVLRSDRSMAAHGLEARTPFLDKTFVEAYLGVPVALRNPRHLGSDKPEKYFLRNTVQKLAPSLLPPDVIWRTKEAFSDGVSGDAGDWYRLIAERAALLSPEGDVCGDVCDGHINPPRTDEQRYYRSLFDSYYPGCAAVIPYFWMPKYVDASDASARTLSVYTRARPRTLLHVMEESV
jgi:asparagine synthase (glutamine-hydrolysing)